MLVDGDDHNDPVADSIRGTLDGHIVLDRAIAEQARYPAVNVLASISRLAPRAWTPEQANLVMKLRAMVARFEDTRDLRLMGGYRKGTDAALDRAIELVPRLYEAMRQGPAEPACADVFQEIARALAAKRSPRQSSLRPLRRADRPSSAGNVLGGTGDGKQRQLNAPPLPPVLTPSLVT